MVVLAASSAVFLVLGTLAVSPRASADVVGLVSIRLAPVYTRSVAVFSEHSSHFYRAAVSM